MLGRVPNWSRRVGFLHTWAQSSRLVINAGPKNVQWRFIAGGGGAVCEHKKLSSSKLFFENFPKAFKRLLRSTPEREEVVVHPPPFANLAQKIGKSVRRPGVMSKARVYTDVNVQRPKEYWDYEALTVQWGYADALISLARLHCGFYSALCFCMHVFSSCMNFLLPTFPADKF